MHAKRKGHDGPAGSPLSGLPQPQMRFASEHRRHITLCERMAIGAEMRG